MRKRFLHGATLTNRGEKKIMMYMGYEIIQLFGRYEVHEKDMIASALTLDGIKKMIARHVWEKAYAAWKKTGDPKYLYEADKAWIAIAPHRH